MRNGLSNFRAFWHALSAKNISIPHRAGSPPWYRCGSERYRSNTCSFDVIPLVGSGSVTTNLGSTFDRSLPMGIFGHWVTFGSGTMHGAESTTPVQSVPPGCFQSCDVVMWIEMRPPTEWPKRKRGSFEYSGRVSTCATKALKSCT